MRYVFTAITILLCAGMTWAQEEPLPDRTTVAKWTFDAPGDEAGWRVGHAVGPLTAEAGALNGMRFMIWLDSVVGSWAFNVVLFFPMAYFFIRRVESRRASLEFLSLVEQRYPEALGREGMASDIAGFRTSPDL